MLLAQEQRHTLRHAMHQVVVENQTLLIWLTEIHACSIDLCD